VRKSASEIVLERHQYLAKCEGITDEQFLDGDFYRRHPEKHKEIRGVSYSPKR
jgi:hypothetical protein